MKSLANRYSRLPKNFWIVLAVVCFTAEGVRAGDIFWTNALGGNWGAAFNWSPNQVPASSDNAFITQNGTYTVTVNVNATVAGLTVGAPSGTQTVSIPGPTVTVNVAGVFGSNATLALSGGYLSGTNSVSGPISWTEGGFGSPSYTGPSGQTTLGSSCVMTISGGLDKYMFSHVLNNAGTINWSGGQLLSYGAPVGATINNLAGALFDLQGDVNTYSYYAVPNAINNAGTFRKSAGSGTASLRYWDLTGSVL